MINARPVDVVPRPPEDALPWEKLSVALVDILGGMQQFVTVDDLRRADDALDESHRGLSSFERLAQAIANVLVAKGAVNEGDLRVRMARLAVTLASDKDHAHPKTRFSNAGVNDIGGLPGGPIDRRHYDAAGWEKLVVALGTVLSRKRLRSVHESRRAYPSRPVRILVATSAGGGTDLVARFMAQWLSERLGQSFFVENRPGGGNNIGTEMAAHSPADGYTLFMANTCQWHQQFALSQPKLQLHRRLCARCKYHGHAAPAARAPVGRGKNPAELIALAKSRPGKLNLASGGVGSTGHMSAELLEMMAGIKFTHVPYRGEALALTDLISGQAQVMISTTGSSLQYAKAGTVRALATTTDERVIELPDVPPLARTVPGYQANAWNGLCAPKGTSPEIITLLNRQVNLAIADPKIKQHIATLGGVALPGSPQDYGRTIAADTDKWAKLVQFSGAHVD